MSNLFDAQTKDVIESRMAQTLHTITEKEQSTMEGTFARDLIDANAVEFESSYAEMAMLRDAAFAETSWGDYLTLRAAEFGVDRKKAVKAKGEVTVTGMAGAYIIRSSLFQTKDGQRFYTLESATIPADAAEVTIPVEAADAGASGNVAEGTITETAKIPRPCRSSSRSSTSTSRPIWDTPSTWVIPGMARFTGTGKLPSRRRPSYPRKE